MKRAITNHLAGLGVVLALAAASPAQAGEGHDAHRNFKRSGL